MAKYLSLLILVSGLLSSCGVVKSIFIGKVRIDTIRIPPIHDTTLVVTVKYFDTTNKALKERYAEKLKISPDSLTNTDLYAFINRWWGTPYVWGGDDLNGIDCSAFIQWLFVEVYKIKIPRTSVQQLYTGRVELFRSAKYLSEGDIVFFRTIDNTVVSHVGVYLGNNRFVHCCVSEGVTISSLDELYYKRRYVAAGRIRAYLAKS